MFKSYLVVIIAGSDTVLTSRTFKHQQIMVGKHMEGILLWWWNGKFSCMHLFYHKKNKHYCAALLIELLFHPKMATVVVKVHENKPVFNDSTQRMTAEWSKKKTILWTFHVCFIRFFRRQQPHFDDCLHQSCRLKHGGDHQHTAICWQSSQD